MERITNIPISNDSEVNIIIENGQKYVQIIEPSRMARPPRPRSPERRPRSPERRPRSRSPVWRSSPLVAQRSPVRRSPERLFPAPVIYPRSPERRPRAPVRRSRSPSPESYSPPQSEREMLSRSPVRLTEAIATPRGSPIRLSEGRQYDVQRTLGIRSSHPLYEVADQINEHLGSNIQINRDEYTGIIELGSADIAQDLDRATIIYTTENGRKVGVTYYLL